MAQHHKYTIADLDNMIPFERDIYVSMLLNYLKQLDDKRKQQSND